MENRRTRKPDLRNRIGEPVKGFFVELRSLTSKFSIGSWRILQKLFQKKHTNAQIVYSKYHETERSLVVALTTEEQVRSFKMTS